MKEEIWLKPCPLCTKAQRTDSVAMFETEDFGIKRFFTKCRNCGCRTRPYSTPEEAAERWNKRNQAYDAWEEIGTRITEIGMSNPAFSIWGDATDNTREMKEDQERHFKHEGMSEKDLRYTLQARSKEDQPENILDRFILLSRDFPDIWFDLNMAEGSTFELKEGQKIYTFTIKSKKVESRAVKIYEKKGGAAK